MFSSGTSGFYLMSVPVNPGAFNPSSCQIHSEGGNNINNTFIIMASYLPYESLDPARSMENIFSCRGERIIAAFDANAHYMIWSIPITR